MRSRVAVGLGLVLAAFGAVNSVRAESEPRGYVCAFSAGTSTSFGSGGFKVQEPAPLDFAIADIDLDTQTAHLVADGDKKAGDLKIVRAINANHFLEVVNEGFLNLTTVYDTQTEDGRHPAVHSRHLGLLGEPVFAQYSGFCTEK